ncbi:NAD-dependent succinate-semialdehyde dehydrogenase [Candidimonas nitroreducens]|uniref:NAD-dependent succinate-semialdehyde dehydrogenase n=1 Tax=Candidimonas nitroreducens TaxID=683354 RepID=A0A225M9S9_9BURK|nr:NAD-dependent succinate-semialdehyde dehydrogenase [Candidimonas nitroreducens]OWT56850.1 NAD-dependent succinate-semialdehyde dehydrogenase [Candidimonas nitroreducens]
MNYPNTQLLIAGRFREAKQGRTLEVKNPATGKPIGTVAHASREDLEEAVAASVEGFNTWCSMPASERGKTMRRAAQLLRERAQETAYMLTQEQGKPLSEARAEIEFSAEIIDWFADEALRIYGRIVPSRNLSATQMVVKDPVGPVAAFTPWNFPVNQIVRKVAAALAAGCSILVKAPEETPACAAELLRAFVDAGVPRGTVGVVFGEPAQISEYLIAHPAIRKVSFTGSTRVGKHLASLAGMHMKRISMELGGHAPVIVAEDADIAYAAKVMTAAKFRNAGQSCTSPTRFLVHESVSEEFATLFAQQASSLKVGSGDVEETQMGPLANERRIRAMAALTADAVDKGAQVIAGGSALDREGYFWQPTVLAAVPTHSRIFNDEPFGPIAPIRSFRTMDEAIAEANRLAYGLAGYAFTRSIENAHKLAQRVTVGMLWINQASAPWPEVPFVGIGDSGYGAEGGPEALDAYTNTRLVSIMSI